MEDKEYMTDGRGRLWPKSIIKDIDLLRDELVNSLVSTATALQEQMREFKKQCLDDVAAFAEMSLEKYDIQMGGKKGNITLLSFDGKKKIQLAVSEFMSFDERIQGAKVLIDECLAEWSEGSHDMLRSLVNDIFDVAQEGKINVRKMLVLRRNYNSSDPRWQKAMGIISDSLRVVTTKSYFRIYEKTGDDDKFVPVSLDMARL